VDIRAAILEEHSKAQALYIAQYIGSDQQRFGELMCLFLGDEYRVTQRAAWVMGHCVENYPSLILPYLPKMLELLEQNPQIHDAIKRNTVRVWTWVELPHELLGRVATLCFDYLADPKEKVATKVHSMEVLYQLCAQEPYISIELRLLIEEQFEAGTAAFKSRGRKILKKLAKEGR